MSRIVIIDYGMGNLRSVQKKVNRTGLDSIITDNCELIKAADKLILPGVGHFLKGMMNLKERKIIDILNKKVLVDQTPILGICLGMQLFTKFSEEGNVPGLGWFDAETIRFVFPDAPIKVPHIGWNSVHLKKECILYKDIPNDTQFYFVHSYFVKCHNDADIISSSWYGHEFVSSIQRNNIFGIQFHPEKSHDIGEKLLFNFLKI